MQPATAKPASSGFYSMQGLEWMTPMSVAHLGRYELDHPVVQGFETYIVILLDSTLYTDINILLYINVYHIISYYIIYII